MLETLQIFHLIFFLGFLVLFGILEYLFPLRKKLGSIKKRWFHNFSLSVLNTVVGRFLLFITPIWVALYVGDRGIGLFNILELHFYLELLLGIILLDFFIYMQHVYAHKWKWFWKIHSVHHSDITLDVTTALRFHVLEIIVSLLIKMALILVFGFDAIAIVLFEIILVSSAMFNHANIKIPESIDKILSSVIVTPNFHQVHHSVKHTETDSNYGFFLSIWDRFFKTYTFHKFRVKKIGLGENRKNLSLKDLLLLDINKK